MKLFFKKWKDIFFSPSTPPQESSVSATSELDLINQPIIQDEPLEVFSPAFEQEDDSSYDNCCRSTTSDSNEINVEIEFNREPVDIDNHKYDTIRESESTISSSEITPSLLDNIKYIKLIECHCEIIKELERYRTRVTCDEALEIIDIISSRLYETAYLSGATPIKDEAEFDSLRHISTPLSMPKNGELIERTIESGIAVEERVFIRAKVVLKEK